VIVQHTSGLVLTAALVGMTLLVGGTLALVDTGMSAAEESTVEAVLAETQSDRLVAGSGPIAIRDHVIDSTAATRLDADTLELAGATAMSVRLDGQELLRVGDPSGGVTVRRIVILQRTTPVERAGRSVTVPRGVTEATVIPHRQTAVFGNGRIVYVGAEKTTLRLSHRTRTTLRTAGSEVTVRYDRVEYESAILSVTVDHHPADGGTS